MQIHTRNEVKTRKHYNRVGDGKDLPVSMGIAWCDENISNMFFYLDAAHALNAIGGSSSPCHKCLKAIRARIEQEVGTHGRTPRLAIKAATVLTFDKLVVGDTVTINGATFEYIAGGKTAGV
jgi:hypothetical protein